MVALLSVLLLQAGLPANASSQSKAASISLRAKWASTPTLLEASEFLVSVFCWPLHTGSQGTAWTLPNKCQSQPCAELPQLKPP